MGLIRKIQQNEPVNEAWTNACLYVLDRKVFDVLQGDYSLEKLLTDNLAEKEQLTTYKGFGFNTDSSLIRLPFPPAKITTFILAPILFLTQMFSEYHNSSAEPWRITLTNTGLETLTAGRILQIRDYIGEEWTK